MHCTTFKEPGGVRSIGQKIHWYNRASQPSVGCIQLIIWGRYLKVTEVDGMKGAVFRYIITSYR